MKKTIATITLATVLTFGATFANANGNGNGGILVGDLTSQPCTGTTTSFDNTGTGILVGDLVSYIVGILVGDLTSQPCTGTTSSFDNHGILIGD